METYLFRSIIQRLASTIAKKKGSTKNENKKEPAGIKILLNF